MKKYLHGAAGSIRLLLLLFFVVAVVVLATGGTPQTLFGLMDNHLLPLAADERNVSDIFGEHLYCSPLPSHPLYSVTPAA